MRKWSKTAVIILSVLSVLTTSLWLWFENRYEKFIRDYVITEVNKNLKVAVNAESAEMNFWSSFPRVSLVIKNISINNPKGAFQRNLNCSAGLGRIGRLSFDFNIIDIIRGKPVIKKIELREFCLGLQELENNQNNYDVFRSDSSSAEAFTIALEKVILRDGLITYENQKNNQDYEIDINEIQGKGNFSESSYSLELLTDLKLLKIKSGNHDFGGGKILKGRWTIIGNEITRKISIKEGRLAELIFMADGNFIDNGLKKSIELNFSSSEASIVELLSMLPPEYAKWKDDYQSEGLIGIKSNFSWNLLNDEFNSLTLLDVVKASVKENTSGIMAQNLTAKISWRYSNQGANQISITQLGANIGESHLRSSLEFNARHEKYFSGIAEGDLDLKQWNEFLKTDTIVELNGRVKGKLNFEGNAIKNIQLTSASGSIQLNQAGMKIHNKNIQLNNISGLISGNQKNIIIKEIKLDYKNTRFYGKAIIPLSEQQREPIVMDLRVPEFRTANWDTKEKKDSSNDSPIPNKWKFQAGIKIDHYYQENFHAENVIAEVFMDNNKIELSQVKFETMGGKTEGKGVVMFPEEGGVSLAVHADIDNINLKTLFQDLNNFGQNTLTSKNISGTTEAEIDLFAQWDKNLDVIDASIETQAYLKVIKGELKDFKPLYSLSDYIEIEELKHIKFSELENQITISNKKIIIPEMEIKSTALNLNCSGSHDFNQDIDYRFSVLLNDILYKKYRSTRKKGDAFGKYEEELPENNARLEIHMSGNMNKPEFAVDKNALKKEFVKELKKEGKTLRRLISEEVNGKGFIESDKKWNFEKSEQMFDIENPEVTSKENTTNKKYSESEKKNTEEKKRKKEKQKNKFNFRESEGQNTDYN